MKAATSPAIYIYLYLRIVTLAERWFISISVPTQPLLEIFHKGAAIKLFLNPKIKFNLKDAKKLLNPHKNSRRKCIDLYSKVVDKQSSVKSLGKLLTILLKSHTNEICDEIWTYDQSLVPNIAIVSLSSGDTERTVSSFSVSNIMNATGTLLNTA